MYTTLYIDLSMNIEYILYIFVWCEDKQYPGGLPYKNEGEVRGTFLGVKFVDGTAWGSKI